VSADGRPAMATRVERTVCARTGQQPAGLEPRGVEPARSHLVVSGREPPAAAVLEDEVPLA
jgi:hypothetical protein